MALDLKVRQASSLSLNGIRQAGSPSYLGDSPKSIAIGHLVGHRQKGTETQKGNAKGKRKRTQKLLLYTGCGCG